jgi:hypothetical protein
MPRPTRCGTAINLFVRDMPRLSVDIDLTYLPMEDRETSLKHIADSLERIKANIDKNQQHTLLLTGCTFKVCKGLSIITMHPTSRSKPNTSIVSFQYP